MSKIETAFHILNSCCVNCVDRFQHMSEEITAWTCSEQLGHAVNGLGVWLRCVVSLALCLGCLTPFLPLCRPTMAQLRTVRRLVNDYQKLRSASVIMRLQGPACYCRAMSSTASSEQFRALCTNSEGTGPPRVLITGGLGQLGGGLAKQLR